MDGPSDRVVGAVLGIATVTISWLLALTAHASGIARTDDWAYARIALDLHHRGHLHLLGWGQMTLVGLVVWAQPWLTVFGEHRRALELSVAPLVVASVMAAHRLARSMVATAPAALAVIAVVIFPGVVRDATTFMTDGPNLALQALVLAVGVAAWRTAPGRRRAVLDAVVVLLGLWAFSVREVAIAAPVAVLLVAIARDGTRRARIAATARLFVLAAACALLWHWRQGLPGNQRYNGHPPIATAVTIITSSMVTVGLGLSPALAASARGWWRPRHRIGRVAGLVVGAVVVASLPVVTAIRHVKNWWLVGDYLQANGMNGDKLALGTRPDALPAPLWTAVVVLAAFATVATAGLVGEAVAGWRTRPRGAAMIRHIGEAGPSSVLALHLVLTGIVLGAAAILNGAVFDRYLWPAILSGSILTFRRTRAAPRLARVGGVGVLAVVAVVSLLLTANSDAYDGARWEAGRFAISQGADPRAVDAGFEWVGAHSTGDGIGAGQGDGAVVSWWSRAFGTVPICYVVSAGPVAGADVTELAAVQWRPFIVAGHASLHVYRRNAPPCAP